MTLFGLFTSFVLIFLLTAPVEAQVTCAQIGAFLSCDMPRGKNTAQLDLGQGMGVITDEQGNVEPYAILTPQTTRPSTVPAPQPPQAPSFPTGMENLYESIEAPQAPTMLLAPLSFGEAGQ